MLKLFNFYISTLVPQKLYWFMAGLVHPWQAVLEDSSTPEEVFKRSKDIVSLLEQLNLINNNYKVLDIGCGVGRAEFTLSKKVKECIGIDISPSMINLAKKYSKSGNTTFLTTNGKDLKMFKVNTFDLVISMLVFQHLPKETFENYIKEAYRVLKNRGKIFFQIPIYFKHKPKDPPKLHPWALRFYHLNELSILLKESRFKKIKFLSTDGSSFTGTDSQALVVAEK